MLRLANELRHHLVNLKLVDYPEAGAEIPCFIDPNEGPPAPGDPGLEAASLAVSIIHTGGASNTPNNDFLDYRNLQIVIRQKAEPESEDELAEALAMKIVFELDGQRTPYKIGDLMISTITLVSPLSEISWRYPGQGKTYALTFAFMLPRERYEVDA